MYEHIAGKQDRLFPSCIKSIYCQNRSTGDALISIVPAKGVLGFIKLQNSMKRETQNTHSGFTGLDVKHI